MRRGRDDLQVLSWRLGGGGEEDWKEECSFGGS